MTSPTRPAPTTTTAASLRTLLDDGTAPFVLDVRTPGEYAGGHLPGSLNLPLTALQDHAAELAEHLDPAHELVLVCRSGARARAAAQALERAGGPAGRVLEGGVQSWVSAGGELATGAGPWELERQVRLVAGGIVLTSVLASSVLPRAKWVAGGIGGGLTFAALSDTCAMGSLLMRLPWNRGSRGHLDQVLAARP